MHRALAWVSVALLAGCVSEGHSGRAHELLRAAKARLAPDRRTRVFDVVPEVRGQKLVLRGEVHDAELQRALLESVAATAELEVVDELRALPDPALGDRTTGIVRISVANLRSEPRHGAELATQVLLGTPLRILKRQRGWLYVQTPNEYLGWTSDPLVLMSPAEHRTWSKRKKVIVTADFAVVQRIPEVAPALPVSDVVAGCILALQGKSGLLFYEVAYPDGRAGYLPVAAAEPLDEWLQAADATPEHIVATAQGLLGVPYLWGGTSTKAMDCSGFTKTVWFLNGVLLPRDASQQEPVGVPVEPGDDMSGLQPGDLVFFGRRAHGGRRERVTHVGISLGGPRFIHCSGDVRINSLDPQAPDYSAYRHRTFLRAKRVSGPGVRRLAELPFYRQP